MVFSEFVSADYHWRGMHTFYEQCGAGTVVDAFWVQLTRSFKRLQRRPDVFMGGHQ